MKILLFDNGTKYLSELKTLLEKYGQVEITTEKSALKSPTTDIVVLSGGHSQSIISHPASYQDEIDFIKTTTKPVIGICLGAEIIAYTFGASLTYLDQASKGLKAINVQVTDNLFTGISDFKVYESHKWAITQLSADLEGLASSDAGFEVFRHKIKLIYGIQFHPEMLQDQSCGDEIFKNLLLHKTL